MNPHLTVSSHARKSNSQAVLSRLQLILHATRPAPNGVSRLVQAMSGWSMKTWRAPSRLCRDARLYLSYDHGLAWIEYTPQPAPSRNGRAYLLLPFATRLATREKPAVCRACLEIFGRYACVSCTSPSCVHLVGKWRGLGSMYTTLDDASPPVFRFAWQFRPSCFPVLFLSVST